MIRTAFAVISLTALAAVLDADPPRSLRASFPDGTGLEIFTQTTGSSQIDPRGQMGIGPGGGPHNDLVNRVIVDSGNNILFVYNVEAARGPRWDTVKIRIQPISEATEASMMKAATPDSPRFSGTHLPTVAAVREFPAVKIGEAVTLDILYNPSTGEKIFDVLRPITTEPSRLSVSAVPAPEAISLKEISIRVNGVSMSAPASFIIGTAIRIDIPGLGTYVLAAYDPHDSSDHVFAAIAHADAKALSWATGRARVEITSGTNVLMRSGKGVVWVYHDAHYQPDVVRLQAADTVEWLFPKK